MHLCRVALLSIVALLAELLLGVAVNLWVTIGSDRPWSHISHVGLFAVHGALGLAVVLLAFAVLAKPFEDASRRDKMSSVMALVGVAGAFGCGLGFVASGGASNYSFGMALGGL